MSKKHKIAYVVSYVCDFFLCLICSLPFLLPKGRKKGKGYG